MNTKTTSLDLSEELLLAISEGDRRAFSWLYDTVAEDLLRYVYNFTKDRTISEDIVHDIFTQLWARRTTLSIENSTRQYLFSAAKYKVLSYMRSEYVGQKYADHFTLFLAEQGIDPIGELMDLRDLQSIIDVALEKLPPKCQHAFRLSRFKQLSIKEIAKDMGISPRTVENYITIGLKTVRKALQEYAWLWIVLHEWGG